MSKSELLDPLNVICKLSLLNLCEEGTRISIYNHIVTIQRPAITQIVSRNIYGDKKNDIYLLLSSILKIVEWYITEYSEVSVTDDVDEIDDLSSLKTPMSMDRKEFETKIVTKKISSVKKEKNRFYKNENILQLMILASKGLEKLRYFYFNIYGNGMYNLGIQKMLDILKQGTECKLDTSSLPYGYNDKKIIKIIEIREIGTIWDDTTIKGIISLFNESNKVIESGKETPEYRKIIEGYYNGIEISLKKKDNEFKHIIKKSQI